MTDRHNLRFLDVLRYLRGTIVFFLLSMSLYQTLSCGMKFWREPVSTHLTFEDVQPHETPGFTICPIPALSFAKLEEYLKRTKAQKQPFRPTYGFTYLSLGRFPKIGNISEAEFLDEVGMPVWKTLNNCVWSTISEGPFSKSRASCKFPTAGPKSHVVLDPDEPMKVHTEAGIWTTTFLVTEQQTHVILCSKFVPYWSSEDQNGETQKNLDMLFLINPTDYYRVNTADASFNFALASGKYDPVYWIFIHEPHASLEMYQVMRPVEPDFVLPLGQRLTVQINVAEKFRFRDRDGRKCLRATDELLGSTSCETWCFESVLLKSRCKLPGYSPKVFGFDTDAFQSQIVDFDPKICRSEDDYREFFNTFNSMDFHRASAELRQCKARCVPKRPCTRLHYEAKESLMENAFRSRNNLKNMTELQNFDHFVNTRVIFKIQASQQVKVFIEENAYDGFSLIGEIGGAWGLFLGFSVLTILETLETAASKVLAKLG